MPRDVSTACAAAAAGTAISPRFAFTVSIPNAGPMVFDGTYLWVGSFDLVTAIDPATGAIVASQPIAGTQFMAYDAPSGTLWLEGGSVGAQVNKVNAQQIIANSGSAPVNSIAFGFGSPSALAIDSSAAGRNVWAVAGGQTTIIKMGSLEVVGTISAPDGYPITQVNEAFSLGGMMLSTSGLAGAANLWFYGHTGTSPWESPFVQQTLSAGAWDGPAQTQFSGQAGDGALYKYAFPAGGGTSGVVQSTLYLTDAADSAAPEIGGINSVTVSPGGAFALVVRQEVDVPNQVYFVGESCPAGTHTVPGVSVPGAVFTAFGGGFAWASFPGPAGGVTAIAF